MSWIRLWKARSRSRNQGRKKDQSPAEFWDSCLHESNCIYSGRIHNICCDNCHSHVAVALEKMQYAGLSHWNMIMLGAWVFFCGKFPPPVFPRFAWSCCPTIVLALIIVFFYGLGNSSPWRSRCKILSKKQNQHNNTTTIKYNWFTLLL